MRSGVEPAREQAPERSRTVTLAFYAGLSLLVAAILLELLPKLLPDGLAGPIGRDSEGLVLALLLALWIQFARPRLTGHPREWAVTVAVAAALVALGLLLLATDLPSRFRTHNETLVAAGVVIAYLQWRRPVPARVALGIAGVFLVLIVVANGTEVMTQFAESVGAFLLVPIAFDVVDRGIFDRDALTSAALRYGWYVLLVAAPLAISLVRRSDGLGPATDAIRYSGRLQEAFVCVLILELYFAVGLGRTGRGSEPGQSAEAPPTRSG